MDKTVTFTEEEYRNIIENMPFIDDDPKAKDAVTQILLVALVRQFDKDSQYENEKS